MANLGGTFDATQVDPTNEFEPLPAGRYDAEIVDSRIEPVSKNEPGKGECLILIWKVVSGQCAGRQIWHRLNLFFRGSEKTPGKVAEIAQRQLSEICHAVGRLNVSDSVELHGGRALVTYGPQKNNPTYNEVKSVKALGGGGAAPARPAAAAPAPAQHSAPPGQAAGAPSGGGWKRRAS